MVEPTLIKKDSQSALLSSFDDRVIALSHASAQYLKRLNVWQSLAEHATAIKQIHVSDRGHYGKARIEAKEHNVDALGYVVALSQIASALINSLNSLNSANSISTSNSTNSLKPQQSQGDAQASISWYCPDKIDQIVWSKSHVDISLASGESISGQLLIACDGAQSVCRQAANIQTSSSDYQQSAVIANVDMERSHQGVAYERFTEFGPIAMLPMQGNQCSLVWTHNSESANDIAQLDDEAFKIELYKAFGAWLGKVNKVSKRSVFPLKLVQAEAQTYHRMALVGNASHTIHPIAGQGFNLGLRDVECLATLIEQHISDAHDVGSFNVLHTYQTQRQADQQEVIGLTDAMVTLFSNQHTPLVAGRNIGIKAMNYLTPLQNMFVNKNYGLLALLSYFGV